MIRSPLTLLCAALTLCSAVDASARGGLLASTQEAMTSCDEVSRDVVCLSVTVEASSERDAQLKRIETQCVPAAKTLGATHYVIQGPVFVAYRCGSGAPRRALVESKGSALGQPEAFERAGLRPWSRHCKRIRTLFPVECDSARRPDTCRRASLAQLELTLAEAPLYHLPSVNKQAFRLKRRGVVEVSVSGVLRRLKGDGGRYVTARPLRVPYRRTTTEGIADAAKHIHRFEVPDSELGDPKAFLRGLRVEALVSPKAFHRPEQGNPAGVEALEVDIVGLRALTADLRWHRTLIAPPESAERGRCPTDEEALP